MWSVALDSNFRGYNPPKASSNAGAEITPTKISGAHERHSGSLYLTEVIVFAGYQLEFEPALLVV